MATAADTDLARVYGVSPALIESMRRQQCTEGEHWEHTDADRRVIWLPAGLDFLPGLLGLEKKEGGAAHASQPAGEIHSLVILRLFPNPLWVLVSTPDGSTAQVRVRQNTKLQPRMRLQCQAEDGQWRCVQPGLAT